MDYVQLIHVNPYHVDSPFLLHTQPPCWCSRWGTRSEACRANDPNFGRKTAVSTLRRRGKSLGKISIYHDLPLKHGDFYDISINIGRIIIFGSSKEEEKPEFLAVWTRKRMTSPEYFGIPYVSSTYKCAGNMRVNGDMGREAPGKKSAVTALHRIQGLNRTFNILSVSKVQFVFPVSAWSDLTNTTNKKVMYDDVSQQKTSVQPTVNRQPLRLQYFWDHIH